jgi:hypothetical protein
MLKMFEHTHTGPFREYAKAGPWQLTLADGVACPFCDRIIHARDAEITDNGFRIVCQHCQRDVLEVRHHAE